MQEYYLEAAQKVSDLAEEYSGDYGLATILRAGSARITELARENAGLIVKSASTDKMKAVVNSANKSE